MTSTEQPLSRSTESYISTSQLCSVDHLSICGRLPYSQPSVSTLADNVFDCDSIEDLCFHLKSINALFSGSNFSLQVIEERSLCEYDHRVVTDYPAEFISAYVDRNYYFIDPIIAKCRTHSGLFLWDEVSTNSPVSQCYQVEAQKYGVGPSGATFVSENSRGDVCALSISSRSNRIKFRDKFELRKSDFCYLAKVVVDAFSELSGLDCAQSFNLTHDQIRVLYDIAHGVPEGDLEKKRYLFGSYSNIKQSILRACGTNTLAQAAILAVKYGQLEEVPYLQKDILNVLSQTGDVERSMCGQRRKPMKRELAFSPASFQYQVMGGEQIETT